MTAARRHRARLCVRHAARRVRRLGLAGTLALAACGGEPEAPDLSRDDFVAAYVELRQAEAQAAGAAEFEERKDEILARYRTSEEELVRYVDHHGQDVEFLAELWDSVQARLQAEPDSAAEGP